MISLNLPDANSLHTFLARQQHESFSYHPVGATLLEQTVDGFDNDDNAVLLGYGETVFQKAVEGLFSWAMFPRPWARILPESTPVKEGATVVMLARVLGLWWCNSCRIVGLVQEPGHTGFAYGTLPGHVECGEERFSVRLGADGAVYYQIRAFSKPRHWLVRLAYPLARRYQRRFVRDSQRAMQDYIRIISNL